jgi:hypothetical protein
MVATNSIIGWVKALGGGLVLSFRNWVTNQDRVLVVTRSPGIDAIRVRKTGDLNFHVLTVRNEKIVALRACRSRDEALGIVASATPDSS